MIASLSPPMRRVLALAILVALPVLAWFLVVAPLAALVTDREAEMTALAEREASLQAIISRIPGLKARGAALQARLDEEGGIWVANSEAVVSARMEEILRAAVAAEDGTVISSSVLQSGSELDFRVVRVRFKVDGTLGTIEHVFAALAKAQPAIFVDGFTIAVPAAAPPREQRPVLNLDVEVMGYLRRAEG